MSRVELYREHMGDPFKVGSATLHFKPGKWRWRFIKNGQIMADSGQAYSRRIDCLNGCATVLNARIYVPSWIAEQPGKATLNGTICYLYQYKADEGLDDWSRASFEHVPERSAIVVRDLTRGAL